MEMRVTRSRFEKVCEDLGLKGNAMSWYDRLVQVYGAPGRVYHNLRHLDECLRELDGARHLAAKPAEVEFALWFHDAVYDAKANDNEEQSAEWAVECLRESAGAVEEGTVERVRNLVMLTKTHESEPGTDGALMVDVDLAILGQPWPRFEEYDQAIRLEYQWVPADVYGVKRAEVLRRFLQRDFIYRTRRFREKYETQARANLARKLGMAGV
jgi:predicted metal-dependent HD superfamily phosphohydrolase